MCTLFVLLCQQLCHFVLPDCVANVGADEDCTMQVNFGLGDQSVVLVVVLHYHEMYSSVVTFVIGSGLRKKKTEMLEAERSMKEQVCCLTCVM